MLSIDVFQQKFIDFLCTHFRKDLTPQISAAYYQAFSSYSDETFIELCDRCFNECERLPAPKWFHEQAERLTEAYRASNVVYLPSAEDREIFHQTPEEQQANIRRLRQMLQRAGIQYRSSRMDYADF